MSRTWGGQHWRAPLPICVCAPKRNGRLDFVDVCVPREDEELGELRHEGGEHLVGEDDAVGAWGIVNIVKDQGESRGG